MKILGIGESVIDKAYITEGNQIPTDGVPTTHVGGPVLISMILLARLEHACTFVTTLGRDQEATIIKKVLKHEQIKVLGRLQRKTKVNPILIHPTTGQRTKLRGNIIHPSIKNLERKFVQQFDIIVIDRHHKEAFYEVLKYKKSSTKIIIDPSTEVSTFTLDMIKYADYPIIPIEALTKIAGKSLLSSLKHMYTISRKPLVVTAGELGSILFDGVRMKLIPALQITSIDTTGAGDIYRGAFAYGITQGWDMTQSIEYANCVAAMHCTRFGNAAAIPTKEEIDLCCKLCVTKKELTKPTINNYFDGLYQI
jgi:sugar/nucleoside kinase (ribokinase family)